MALPIDQYVMDQLELLTLEKRAQARSTRRLFRTLPSRVQIVSKSHSTFGGTLLKVMPMGGRASSMRAGSWIDLVDDSCEETIRGLIISSLPGEVDIHISRVDTINDGVYRVKGVPINSYKYFYQNLKDAHRMPPGLLSTLLGEAQVVGLPEIDNLSYYDSSLNSSQKQAVSFAMNQTNLALISGPPGRCIH